MKRTGKRIGRALLLIASGACLVQVAGCLSGIAPVALSYLQATVLSGLLP